MSTPATIVGLPSAAGTHAARLGMLPGRRYRPNYVISLDGLTMRTEFVEIPDIGSIAFQGATPFVTDHPVTHEELDAATEPPIPIAPTSWPRGARLASDFTLANQVTPASPPGMSIDLLAGTFVLTYCTSHVDTNDTGGHMTRLYFGGATCKNTTTGFHGNDGKTGDDALPSMFLFSDPETKTKEVIGQYSEQVSSGIGVRKGGAYITTLIVCDAPCTVSLQTAQLVNGSNTTSTMKAGSWMSASPLNAVSEPAGDWVTTEEMNAAIGDAIAAIPAPPAGVTMAQVNDAINSAITALKADTNTLTDIMNSSWLKGMNSVIPQDRNFVTQMGLVVAVE